MLLSGEEGVAVVKQRGGRYGGEEGEERRGQAALLFKTEVSLHGIRRLRS